LIYSPDCSKPELLVPNGFSPNGDGVADTWVIEGLEYYPENTVYIFNRWGNEIYSASPYKNDWGGLTNDGKLIPAGTYYFLLRLTPKGKAEYKGYIYVNY